MRQKKKTPLLDLYHELMDMTEPTLRDLGLCCTLASLPEADDELIEMLDRFEPYKRTLNKLTTNKTKNNYLGLYWGAEEDIPYVELDFKGPESRQIKHQFGPFRQTVLLLLAAQRGEL